MVQNCKAKVKTYSTRSMADFRARIIECHFEGMYLEIDGREVGVQLLIDLKSHTLKRMQRATAQVVNFFTISL